MGEAIQSFVEDALGITNGVFGVNAQEMLIQISSTIILFLVVRFFFWNKVTAYLEERKQAMITEYNDAKSANDEAKSMRDEAQGELELLKTRSKSLIDDAKVRGEDERKAILEKAKSEADNLVVEAQKEIESNIEKARSSINKEIVSVATLMAEKIIKKEIDESKHKELIKEVTKEVAN
jgi:F-type H+-transporting ATPase subunit b